MNTQDAARLYLAGKISKAEHDAAWDADAKRQQRAQEPPRPKIRKKDLRPGPPAGVEHRYANISAQAFLDPRVSSTEKILIQYIKMMARGRPEVELFVEQIAEALFITPRHVQRLQRAAERHQLIYVTHRRTGRLNSTNLYTLHENSIPKPQAHPHRPSASPARYRVTKMSPHEESLKNSPPYPPSPGRGGEKRPGASRAGSARGNDASGGSELGKILRFDQGASQERAAKIEPDPRQLDLEDAIARAKSTGPPSS